MSPRSIADALGEVRARLATAARAAGRDPADVRLLAVSKTVPAERVREAVLAGQQDLGENYAQELRDKAPLVPGARWHFIGPLQRNKVKYVVGTAVLVHSVDDEALGAAIAAHAAKLQRVQACLVQVNVGGEAQKSGCEPAQLPRLLDALRAHDALRIEGLMCIPPAVGDPRPCFARLRTLAAQHGLRELSMGMSADYEAAIAEGATWVRIGRSLFGSRA